MCVVVGVWCVRVMSVGGGGKESRREGGGMCVREGVCVCGEEREEEGRGRGREG